MVSGYHHGFWLGVTDIHVENQFVALSNCRRPHYNHWAKGEPNNHVLGIFNYFVIFNFV